MILIDRRLAGRRERREKREDRGALREVLRSSLETGGELELKSMHTIIVIKERSRPRVHSGEEAKGRRTMADSYAAAWPDKFSNDLFIYLVLFISERTFEHRETGTIYIITSESTDDDRVDRGSASALLVIINESCVTNPCFVGLERSAYWPHDRAASLRERRFSSRASNTGLRSLDIILPHSPPLSLSLILITFSRYHFLP